MFQQPRETRLPSYHLPALCSGPEQEQRTSSSPPFALDLFTLFVPWGHTCKHVTQKIYPKACTGCGPCANTCRWFAMIYSNGGGPSQRASLIYQKGNPEDIPINAAGRRTCRHHKLTRHGGVRWAICSSPPSRCAQRLSPAQWFTSATLCTPRTRTFPIFLLQHRQQGSLQEEHIRARRGSELQSRAVFKPRLCHCWARSPGLLLCLL